MVPKQQKHFDSVRMTFNLKYSNNNKKNWFKYEFDFQQATMDKQNGHALSNYQFLCDREVIKFSNDPEEPQENKF